MMLVNNLERTQSLVDSLEELILQHYVEESFHGNIMMSDKSFHQFSQIPSVGRSVQSAALKSIGQ